MQRPFPYTESTVYGISHLFASRLFFLFLPDFAVYPRADLLDEHARTRSFRVVDAVIAPLLHPDVPRLFCPEPIVSA